MTRCQGFDLELNSCGLGRLGNHDLELCRLPRKLSFRCDALVHVSVGLGRVFDVKVFDLNGTEWLRRYEFRHIERQRATGRKASLCPVQSPLPGSHFRIGADSMFEKQDAPSQLQHSKKFVHGLRSVWDATQGDRTDDTIERTIVKWERFTADDLLVYFDAGFIDAALQLLAHSLIRINGRNPFDVLRVMRQIQSSTNADFQDLAAHTGKLLLAMLRPERLVDHAIVEAWEDNFRVEAQTCSPCANLFATVHSSDEFQQVLNLR